LSLNIQSQGYGIGLVFFGFYCILIGYVIFKTNAIPKIIGVAYALAGLCYLINSFTMFLSKGFVNPHFVYLAIPIFIGELSLCMWLLIKGIDTTKLEKVNQCMFTLKKVIWNVNSGFTLRHMKSLKHLDII
jgi:hypothetical protein